MKKFIISENWKRFKEVDKILVDNMSPIKSESQLCKYIYDKFGEGRYMVLAWQKGIEGFWCFWLGFIQENGFVRDLSKNKELEAAKKALFKANQQKIDYEERQMLEEDLDLEHEIAQEGGKKRRGPIGIEKSRPGQMHPYEEY
jgi:hypothetical protein